MREEGIKFHGGAILIGWQLDHVAREYSNILASSCVLFILCYCYCIVCYNIWNAKNILVQKNFLIVISTVEKKFAKTQAFDLLRYFHFATE